ncbi:MAG: PRC-barrel domain-containing protein [Actinomycetota bacterium]|nr:PRC-barrel domain-containing protein [Actinomycetota bacterium]
MRLSELLRRPVVDESGTEVGHVHDVRLVRDGPPMGEFGPAYRVLGLVVGPRGIGERLGYGRTDMTGPWLIAAPLSLRHRRARFVPWDRVAEVSKERVRISGSVDDLSEPEDIPS